MRPSIPAILVLLVTFAPHAALALGAGDTMADWAGASEAERSGVLDALDAKSHGSGHVSRSAVIDCMNRAAEAGGHGGFRIADMAKACSAPHPGDDGADQMGI